jgi:hypothetical protein
MGSIEQNVGGEISIGFELNRLAEIKSLQIGLLESGDDIAGLSGCGSASWSETRFNDKRNEPWLSGVCNDIQNYFDLFTSSVM